MLTRVEMATLRAFLTTAGITQTQSLPTFLSRWLITDSALPTTTSFSCWHTEWMKLGLLAARGRVTLVTFPTVAKISKPHTGAFLMRLVFCGFGGATISWQHLTSRCQTHREATVSVLNASLTLAGFGLTAPTRVPVSSLRLAPMFRVRFLVAVASVTT